MNSYPLAWVSMISMVIVSLFAGCLDSGDDTSPMDIQISNLTTNSYSISVSLVDESGNEEYEETITMGPNSDHLMDDIISKVGVYKLNITLSDGRWKEADVGVGDHLGLVGITISDDIIIIGQKVE